MKLIYTFLFFLFVVNQHLTAQENSLEAFFSRADQFLSENTSKGKVDYQHIKNNPGLINALYSQIENMSLENASDKEKKAFYINAYNLIVIQAVSKYFPLKSAMDKSGFFDKVKHKVAGQNMTLDYLEIKKLIIPYDDPRVHFAVACAAKSCPALADFAYVPENLDEQLQSRTKMALNNPEFIKLRPGKKEVAVSKIFDWYEEDFTQKGQTVIEYLNKYRLKPIPGDYTLTYYEYNWSLNAQSSS